MRKFCFVLSLFLLGFIVSRNSIKDSEVVNQVLLKNVEALASVGNIFPTYCRASGEVTCPDNGIKVKTVYEGYNVDPDEDIY